MVAVASVGIDPAVEIVYISVKVKRRGSAAGYSPDVSEEKKGVGWGKGGLGWTCIGCDGEKR